MSRSIQLVSAREIGPEVLAEFLRRSFGPDKGQFLERHGSWWHRGDENRWVLTDGARIVGYTGVIPTVCQVGGSSRRALWWMDLVIDPDYRGMGLQTRFDDLVQSQNSLLLGFPNQLAAKIHRHHGWGVREDLRTLLLPLEPAGMRRVVRAEGLRGVALRTTAAVGRPAAAVWRGWLRHRGATRSAVAGAARRIEPGAAQLAAVALDHLDESLVTTRRDEEYLDWRYLSAPYRDQLRFYAAGHDRQPQVVLVARRLEDRAERWLDIFGAMQEVDLLRTLARKAVADAAASGVTQITVLTASPELRQVLRRAGFVVGAISRMCWLDSQRETMNRISDLPHHWCLGDSDNDSPEDSVQPRTVFTRGRTSRD